jgi:two-component system, chemotaxis family, sensor kinase CheA
MTQAPDPMAEIRASFFVECEELLEALQDGLQTIFDGTDDPETINVVFRAVHSIKGGAGAFGLEAMVRFAHRFETVLDEVRSGRMEVGEDTLKIFFRAADHLSDLIKVSRDGDALPDAATDELLAQLGALLGDVGDATGDEAEEAEIDFVPMGLSLDLDLGDDVPPLPPLDAGKSELATATGFPDGTVTIRFTPSAELFETGNEPFQLLRNLQDLGRAEIQCDWSSLPPLAELSPEIPHLSWTIQLQSEAEEAEIQAIFEFVEGLCVLEIETAGMPLPLFPSPVASVPDAVAASEAHPEPLPNDLETPDEAAVTDRSTSAASPRTAADPSAAAAAKSVVRVDLDRIERLVNLVGELVINQAMLSQSLEEVGLSPHSDAMEGLEEFQRLTRDIQDSVMMIRAQPVKSLFQRMSRIVREASSAVGKDVRLKTEGETTEVDKTVIERLADPLTHMIRNAVDHGLETTADRLAAGKSAQGIVRLSAAHKSGRVVIEVADDGAGINRAKVQQIAIDKGLIAADAQLSESEIDNLLFLPGFSTASEVSDLSGRGVGMDVVRTAIQALGGRITITSTPGAGTVFSISLPLTLAVLDGMVVQVAGETLVLPLNLVIETLTLADGDVETIYPGAQVIRVRGEFVPVYDLGVALGYCGPRDTYDDAVVLLIAPCEGNRAALIIDNIQDQRQVVIKGLDDSFYRAPGIAAATILGDGQIALILDPSDLVTHAASEPGMGARIQDGGTAA